MTDQTFETPPSRNRLGVAGFLTNLAAIVVFFVIATQPAKQINEPSSESGQAVGEAVFAAVMPIAGALVVSGVVMSVGTLICLFALGWAPRRWAIAGLVLGPGLVVGLSLLQSVMTSSP